MPDRLNTVLEDGRLEQLRQMAGGQRKVGRYLSDVVAWLWANKEKLDAYSPSSINLEKVDEIEKQIDSLSQSYNELQRKMDGIEAITRAVMDATPNEDAKAAIRQSLIQQGLLVPQQDSSQNDT